jgi:hypothetical protein
MREVGARPTSRLFLSPSAKIEVGKRFCCGGVLRSRRGKEKRRKGENVFGREKGQNTTRAIASGRVEGSRRGGGGDTKTGG